MRTTTLGDKWYPVTLRLAMNVAHCPVRPAALIDYAYNHNHQIVHSTRRMLMSNTWMCFCAHTIRAVRVHTTFTEWCARRIFMRDCVGFIQSGKMTSNCCDESSGRISSIDVMEPFQPDILVSHELRRPL